MFIDIRKLFLFYVVLFLISGYSVFGMEENDEIRDDIRKMFFSETRNTGYRGKPNIHSNVVIITGENGSGSGVKAMLGKLPVIISNAHVIFKIQNPKIQDMQGRFYEIERIYASKTRDLVILKYRYENENDKNLLKIVPPFDRYNKGTPVTAYGNTLGHGVIAETKGLLVATGPEFVEMTNGIVGGNSGGPLIEDRTGKIIGISTLSRIVAPNIWNMNTPYKSTYRSLKVRYFAVRVDNLDVSDIETISANGYQEDQKMYDMVQDYLSNFQEMLHNRNLKNSALLRKLKNTSINFAPKLKELDQYSWKSSYLKNDYEENRKVINRFFRQLDMKNEMLYAAVNEIWQKEDIKTRSVHSSAKIVPCKSCRATGLVEHSSKKRWEQQPFRTREENPKSRLRMETNYIGRQCPACKGRKTQVLTESVSCSQYVVPENILSEIHSKIKLPSRPFNGFVIGGEMMEEYERFSYYQEKNILLFRAPNPFGATLIFDGNHVMQDAENTILTFMLGRLVRVQISFPSSQQTWYNLKDFIEENFSEIDAYCVTLSTERNRIFVTCSHEIFPVLMQIDESKSGSAVTGSIGL